MERLADLKNVFDTKFLDDRIVVTTYRDEPYQFGGKTHYKRVFTNHTFYTKMYEAEDAKTFNGRTVYVRKNGTKKPRVKKDNSCRMLVKLTPELKDRIKKVLNK